MGGRFCSVLPRKGRGQWLILNSNKRIENADTRCGRIANSPERGFLVAYGENQRSLFAKRGKVNLANRSKSYKSFLPRKGREQWLVFDPKSALEMLMLDSGELQIRPNWESALEMLILWPVELQIRPNGWWLVYSE